MITYEQRQQIEELKKKYEDIIEVFHPEDKGERLRELEEESLKPDFWTDQKKAQQVNREIRMIKKIVEDMRKIKSLFEDLEVGIELAEEDPSMEEHVESIIGEISRRLRDFELELILNGKFDDSNAYLTIHPGAGGTESQDWASMLLRMYTRWAERRGYSAELVDYQEGEEAGIKSATLYIKGDFVYGYLKYERGVHRLVRISPFDANKRRHTSFASVNVLPEIEDDIDIEIRPEDLRVDTYRASGAGGQYVNKTESAIRITHIPTGIVVSCQIERSQLQNRETAMKMLKARLYQLEVEKRRKQIEQIQGELREISWGNQIRSYVFQPYTMVKDHRTDVETGNIEAVMDGEIDEFIEAELVYYAKLGLNE
ncbi:MAG TPA: peptide chain release factor 2 [Fervidobacterium sp.]|nr:peptide chain release factor 2 [Fervidobacterium sp.]NLH38418.1 peptide chain release factor 2 [Thermotogaceae bacterium]HCL98416.1 peptide chain release factor 2 [Fervidobacterium sp.]HOV53618.1 peptide chain release factor 2 [Fervidobacterium sp.]HUM75484.1 peptide chain release factor 2 [Fervidobacterium sp.]